MSLLEVRAVSKQFGGLLAVDGVSFSVGESEIVGVIGPNGAGKSTLFNLIAGFHRCDAGEIVFAGSRIASLPPHRIAAMGLVKTFQLVKPFGSMTIADNLLVPLLRRGFSHRDAAERAHDILARLGLAQTAEALPGKLPYAMRRRLEIARALAAAPRLLLLDEALAGLTPAELQDLLETLRAIHAEGIGLLMIEHVMAATMALCHRILVLDKGRPIALGTPAEVSRDRTVIDAYLGRDD